MRKTIGTENITSSVNRKIAQVRSCSSKTLSLKAKSTELHGWKFVGIGWEISLGQRRWRQIFCQFLIRSTRCCFHMIHFGKTLFLAHCTDFTHVHAAPERVNHPLWQHLCYFVSTNLFRPTCSFSSQEFIARLRAEWLWGHPVGASRSVTVSF